MVCELAPYANTDRQFAHASIEFIFSDHSEDNLRNIADAVLASGGDIVAIEKIREGAFGMGTSEEKEELSERMTRFIAHGSTITQTAGEYFQTDEPFFTRLLDNLKGSGKRIVLIDMGTDDEGYTYYRKAQSARHAYNNSAEGSIESDDLFLDYLLATAQANEYREHIMKGQLVALAQTNPGSKITVMMGAMHTWVSHNLSPAIKSKRIFVPADEAAATYAPGEKMHFDKPWSDIRTIRFNLQKLGLSVLGNISED